MKKCSCFSGLSYEECCKPFHQGKFPDNALQLMRSRYSAYALKNARYIVETTHPENPQFTKNIDLWISQIERFCQITSFQGLEILDFTPAKYTSYVTFKAILFQGSADVSFIEKSSFEKIDERWLYRACLGIC